jgi:hypothetical protein
MSPNKDPNMPSMDQIANNTILVVVSRVMTILALPVFLWFVGYVSGLGTAIDMVKSDLAIEKVRVESNIQSQADLRTQLQALDQRTILILQSVARLEASNKTAYLYR